jgi:hypothetical protein
MMLECWKMEPEQRPSFAALFARLSQVKDSMTSSHGMTSAASSSSSLRPASAVASPAGRSSQSAAAAAAASPVAPALPPPRGSRTSSISGEPVAGGPPPVPSGDPVLANCLALTKDVYGKSQEIVRYADSSDQLAAELKELVKIAAQLLSLCDKLGKAFLTSEVKGLIKTAAKAHKTLAKAKPVMSKIQEPIETLRESVRSLNKAFKTF